MQRTIFAEACVSKTHCFPFGQSCIYTRAAIASVAFLITLANFSTSAQDSERKPMQKKAMPRMRNYTYSKHSTVERTPSRVNLSPTQPRTTPS
jgi:hypothetical protein